MTNRYLDPKDPRNKPEVQLFVSDSWGIYIPQRFAQSIKRECVPKELHEDLDILAKGPPGAMQSEEGASEWYWDIWTYICDHAVITEPNGTRYTIYQDGDCWLIPEGMEWNDEEACFQWPAEDDEEESAST